MYVRVYVCVSVCVHDDIILHSKLLSNVTQTTFHIWTLHKNLVSQIGG